ncbi:MAG: DUF1736 domain-containing protein [Gemmatimonadetes bacterium]|nr:DUF1736 domain-containing protein [Gemmatimonadota bacterium]NNM07297.1 DUF1736 domain-containing protein [Gemmatimonadota bacterium]
MHPRSLLNPWGSRRWAWDLLISGAALAIFMKTVAFGWVYDDQMEVVRNTLVHSLQYIPDLFTATAWAGSGMETYLYRPLTAVTYAVNYQISALEPWSYHLVNVLLHAGCSMLVFRVGRSWNFPLAAAGLGALLFALHPVHVEVVAAVSGRKDLMATFFALAMVLGHRKAVARGGWRIALPLAAFASALFSKEVGLMALTLVAAQDWFLETDRRAFLRNQRVPSLYVAYLVVLLVFILVRNQVTGGFVVPETSFFDNPLTGAPTLVRLASSLVVVARGFLLLGVPIGLSPDYSFNAIPLVEGMGDPRIWGSLALFGVLAAGLVRAGRDNPVLKLATVWYLLAIFPTSNVVFAVGTIFAERLLFLPSVAFCLVAGFGLYNLRQRSIRFGESMVLVLLALAGVQTVRYSGVWEDDLSLFTWAVQQVPNSTKAHHKLGEEQLRAGQFGDALRSLKKAMEIAPDNEFAAVTLGQASQQIALLYARESGIRSTDPDILYLLGQMRRDEGDFEGARSAWEAAVELDPVHAEALGDLGALMVQEGDTTGGRRRLEESVRAKPGAAAPWLNLGRLHLARGENEEAAAALGRFVEVAGPQWQNEIRWARTVLGNLTRR